MLMSGGGGGGRGGGRGGWWQWRRNVSMLPVAAECELCFRQSMNAEYSDITTEYELCFNLSLKHCGSTLSVFVQCLKLWNPRLFKAVSRKNSRLL